MTSDDAELELAFIESKYLGKPQPPPRFETPEGIAERRDEAAKQLYLAEQSGNPRAKDAARRQHALARRMTTAAGPVSVEQVGRNALCPCGSGAKAKWCCSR